MAKKKPKAKKAKGMSRKEVKKAMRGSRKQLSELSGISDW